ASLAYSVPMGSYGDASSIAAEEHPTPGGHQPPLVPFNAVSPSYFETMKIQLLEGRSFTDADNESSPQVAIVNQTLADRVWPHEDRLGKRFMNDAPKGTLWRVVGVAQNGKYEFLGEDPQPYFYVPLAQKFMSMRALEIRTSLQPESLMLPVQQLVKNLD